MEIKKAIIPIAGLGTRFLPLAKVLPKELWPLVDKPIVQYLIEEAKASGINQIIFVVSQEKKTILDYFKRSPKIEKILKERKKDHILKEMKELEELCQGISFSYVFQKKPLGCAHAILQAAGMVRKEPAAILFGDDIVDSETPCLLQLAKVLKTCQKPVIALHRLPKEKISAYGVVDAEKIANRLYKIKKIIEKPKIDQAPSDLAIVGKYIITPEVFGYLKKGKVSDKGEMLFANFLDKMIQDGKIIYGYEFEGKWLECGDIYSWLESHLYFSLKHPEFGPKLKKFFKTF